MHYVVRARDLGVGTAASVPRVMRTILDSLRYWPRGQGTMAFDLYPQGMCTCAGCALTRRFNLDRIHTFMLDNPA